MRYDTFFSTFKSFRRLWCIFVSMAFGGHTSDSFSESFIRKAALTHNIAREGGRDLFRGMCPGIGSPVVSGKKSRDLLSAFLVLQRPFRIGSGHGAPRAFPASCTPLASVGEGVEENMRPFRTSPRAYHVALFSTPHLVLLALCAPVDLKMLNLLLIDFFA